MSRILIVHPGPDFSVADVYRGWVKSMRKLGHQIMVYNTNELDRLTFYGNVVFQNKEVKPCEHGYGPVRQAMVDPEMIAQMATKGLFETCYTFWPDVVFFVSAFFQAGQTLEILRRRGHKIVMLHTESPYQDDEQMMRGAYANLNLLNDPTNFEQWKSVGPCAYIPHSFDADVHFPVYPRDYSIDFSFIGTSFVSRLKFFNDMNFDGIDTVFGGNGWDTVPPEYQHLWRYLGHLPTECVDNTETARIYRMTKVGLNLYRREGEEKQQGKGWAMGPREVEMAACGMFFIRDARPESDEVFPMLPTFSSAAEAEELIRYYKDHDAEREDLADQALNAVQDRTFDSQCEFVFDLMEKLGII
jgi:spore maturation protein CgeB